MCIDIGKPFDAAEAYMIYTVRIYRAMGGVKIRVNRQETNGLQWAWEKFSRQLIALIMEYINARLLKRSLLAEHVYCYQVMGSLDVRQNQIPRPKLNLTTFIETLLKISL